MSIELFIQVDGDSVVGICFVGIQNHGMRQGFVLVPYGICLLIGEAFMIRGLFSCLLGPKLNCFYKYLLDSSINA